MFFFSLVLFYLINVYLNRKFKILMIMFVFLKELQLFFIYFKCINKIVRNQFIIGKFLFFINLTYYDNQK